MDTTPFDDTVLDEALEKLRLSRKDRSIEHWVENFAEMKHLKMRVAQKLCDKGILKEEKGKVLFVFNETKYPEINPIPEQRIVERVRQAIVNENAEVDIRTTILISLLYKTEMLPIAIASKEIKAHKKHLKKIIQGEKIGAATQEVLESVHTAILIATIIPAISAATIVTVTSS